MWSGGLRVGFSFSYFREVRFSKRLGVYVYKWDCVIVDMEDLRGVLNYLSFYGSIKY